MTGEILTCAQMAKADAFAVAHGVPSLTLMENAGRAVAEAVTARFKPCAVTVLCGPGNNGGDGFVVARLLSEDGFGVRVAHDAEPKGDAAAMSEKWKGAREALTPAALDGARLVVDGLFGAGLIRPLEGAYAQIVEALNDLPVVAIEQRRVRLRDGLRLAGFFVSSFMPSRIQLIVLALGAALLAGCATSSATRATGNSAGTGNSLNVFSSVS